MPSLFCLSTFQIKPECLEDSFPPELDYPLTLPLSDPEETQVLHTQGMQLEEIHAAVPQLDNPDLPHSMSVSCDHNYTVEDSVQQKKRIEQLEEQLDKLRKKLKTSQQKCRRQERQLKRLKAVGEFQRAKRELTLGEGYVILPKQLYDVLKGIDTIDGL